VSTLIDEESQLLERAAATVKNWGQMRLSDGRALAEVMTLSGAPMWEVAAPSLALHPVARALSLGNNPPAFPLKIRPYLVRAQQAIYDLLTIQRGNRRCIQWPTGSTWLFLGFSAYMYRDILQPVVSFIQANFRQIQPVVIHDWRNSTLIRHAPRSSHQSIWQHWDKSVADQAKILTRLSMEARRDIYAGGLPNAIQSSGTVSWRQAQPVFSWFFHAFLPRLLPQVAIAQCVLRQHTPALIISPDVADPRTRMYCLVGRSLGIPSLQLQFGIYNTAGVEWKFLVADRLAAWSESAAKVFSAHGVPADRIVITGSSRYDWLGNTSDAGIKQTRIRLGVPDGKLVVLFASTYSIKAYGTLLNPRRLEAFKEALFKTANQIEGLCLVVKPHPLENVRATRRLARGCRNVLFADQRSDIRELIPACDAFIAMGSTSTMEALIARKLVISPNFPGLAWWDDIYLKNNVAFGVDSEEELAHVLRTLAVGKCGQLLADLEPARQSFLSKWVFGLDGQASARIVALAQEMARS